MKKILTIVFLLLMSNGIIKAQNLLAVGTGSAPSTTSLQSFDVSVSPSDNNYFPVGVYQNDPRKSKTRMEGYFQTFQKHGVTDYYPFAGSDGHTNYPSQIVEHYETVDYMQQAIDLECYRFTYWYLFLTDDSIGRIL